ncbi:hypothetical protein [Cognatishimia sp.]|uniref:hypothetical protein n=1 Tax=Cognatishimia sp. TaxID=2211648 RepID=UPI003513D94B|nr:hypothetical protein [Cognatishimia sp.]
MIIGLLGLIGSGKGTCADYLIDKGYKKASFADSVKDAVSVIFQWPRHLLEGDTPESREWREQVDSYWDAILDLPEPITPRYMLQYVATDLFRDNFFYDIWIHSFKRRYSDHKNLVIPDVRFPNEMLAIKQLRGKLIRVSRGEDPKWLTDLKELCYHNTNSLENVLQDVVDKHKIDKPHVSEWAYLRSSSLIDCHIENNSTVEDLYLNLESCL